MLSNNLPKWKKQRIRELEEDLAFYGNEQKTDRERWVVIQLLEALRVNFVYSELQDASEPTDVEFRGTHFQVKEIMYKGRRRGDEIRKEIERTKSARSRKELLTHYHPIDISFSDVVLQAYSRAHTLESQNKYGARECAAIDLLCYFNWHNHFIVPPLSVVMRTVGFRSLSVVSSLYCAVAYAHTNASMILRANVGIALELK